MPSQKVRANSQDFDMSPETTSLVVRADQAIAAAAAAKRQLASTLGLVDDARTHRIDLMDEYETLRRTQARAIAAARRFAANKVDL
jgi:hypothetical protein